MTGEAPILNRSRDHDRAILSSLARPVLGLKKTSPETSTFEDVIHGAGKVEEITAKAIGRVFSDDPKYRDIFGSSDYWSQIGFMDLAKDAGLNQDNFGTLGPTLAAIVGISAAIANPLDPLNKLKVLGLTKAGVAGKALSQLGTAEEALKAVEVGGKTIYQIDPKIVTQRLKEKKEALAAGGLTGDVLKNTKQSIKDAEEHLRNNEELNSILKRLQLGGSKIDDIRLAGSLHEQVKKGQRHLLGFSSPARFDQLSLLGIDSSELAGASRLGIGPRSGSAALVRGIETAKGKATSVARDLGADLLERAGVHAIRSEQGRDAMVRIRGILQSRQASPALIEDDLMNLMARLKLEPEELLQVTDAMETVPLEERMMVKSIIEKIVDEGKDPFATRIGAGVKTVSEDSKLAQAGEITDDQKLLLTPSGILPNDVPRAVARLQSSQNYPTWSFPDGSELRLADEFVFLKPGSMRSEVADFNALNKALGVRAYREIEHEGQKYFLARKIPGGAPITDTNLFGAEHLDNLTALLAHLGRRQRTLVDLTAKDLIVNPLGGVQLVNPAIIKKTSSSGDALRRSREVLDKFLDTETLIPRGSMREHHFLKSLAAAKRAPSAVRVQPFRSSADEPVMNVNSLLNEAVNASVERDFVRGSAQGFQPIDIAGTTNDPRDFARANNIENERGRILAQLRRGEAPTIDPIILTRDPSGNLYIREGHARAVAARLLDLDIVPIRVAEAYGDAMDATRKFYVGRTARLDEFFRKDGGLATAALGTKHPFSMDYKVLDDGDQFVSLTSEGLKGLASTNDLSRVLARLVQVGLPPGVGKDSRPGLLGQTLAKKFGSPELASAQVAKLVEESANYQEFSQKLHELAGPLSNRNNLQKPVHSAKAAEEWTNLQVAAGFHLDELAQRGYLTPASAVNTRRLDMVSRGAKGTVIVVNPERNALVLSDVTKSNEQLTETLKSMLSKFGGAQEVDPFGTAIVRGANGVSKEYKLSEFVDSPHPSLSETIVQKSGFTISEKELERLRVDEGIVRLSKDTASSIPSVVKGIALKGKDPAQIARLPFIVTRSGDIFMSTKHEDVPGMLGAMFGEGPIYAQERGIVSPGRITITDPLGSQMARVGKNEVRQLEDRIHLLASKFDEAGFARSNLLDIRPQFDRSVWDQMFGSRSTVGDVLARGWKLQIPEFLDDMPLEIRPELSDRVVFVREPNFKNPNQQKLFEFLRGTNDGQFIEEAMKGLPVTYWASYFPRFQTQAAKDAFNKAGFDFIKTHPELLKHTEGFLKGRKITDMTTREFNDLIDTIRTLSSEGKVKGLEPERILEDIVEGVKNQYHRTLDKDLARQYKEIGDAMPEGSRFFHEDPIWATSLRVQAGQRAIATHEVVETLKETGAVWVGDPKGLRALVTSQDSSGKVAEEIAKLQRQQDQVQARLDSLMDSPDVPTAERAKLADEVKDLDAQIGVKRMEQDSKHKTFVGKNGVAAGGIDFRKDQVYISGNDAQDLLSRGVIKPEDFPIGASDALVPVDFAKVESILSAEGKEVILFNRETAAIANRFFGMQTRDGFKTFLKWWDELHSVYRAWTLFPIPSFHIRNLLSDGLLAYVNNVDMGNVETAAKMLKTVHQKRKGVVSIEQSREMLSSMQIPTGAQTVVDGQTIYDEWFRRGGLQGLFYNEFSRFGSLRRASDFSRAATSLGGLVPSAEATGSILVDNPLIRTGMKVGNFAQSHMRLAAFLDEFRKTGSFDLAERKMKSTFYDYSDLSLVERSVLKRVIPFYTWLRHNIPAMLKTMVTEPVKHVRVLQGIHRIEQGALDHQPPTEGGIPDYIEDNFGFALSKDKSGKYFMKAAEGLFPMFDVYNLFGGDGFGSMIVNGITPFAKFPIEQLANRSLYTGQEIGKEPFGMAEPAKSMTMGRFGLTRGMTAEGPLSVLNLVANESAVRSFFRVGSVAANVLDDLLDKRNWLNGEPTIGVALWDLALGRGMVVDPVKVQAAVMYKHKEMLGKLDRAEKYYRENGNAWLAEEVAKRKLNFMLQFGGSR